MFLLRKQPKIKNRIPIYTPTYNGNKWSNFVTLQTCSNASDKKQNCSFVATLSPSVKCLREDITKVNCSIYMKYLLYMILSISLFKCSNYMWNKWPSRWHKLPISVDLVHSIVVSMVITSWDSSFLAQPWLHLYYVGVLTGHLRKRKAPIAGVWMAECKEAYIVVANTRALICTHHLNYPHLF